MLELNKYFVVLVMASAFLLLGCDNGSSNKGFDPFGRKDINACLVED